MKYLIELEINAPRDRVIELFDNADNLKQWQPELMLFEHESGIAGQVGARSRLVYKMGKREVEMIETITSRNLPDEFSGTYETNGVWNRVENRFIDVDGDRTKWMLESEFRCRGFLMVMAFLMPGMFKKQTLKFMQQFKQFAENA